MERRTFLNSLNLIEQRTKLIIGNMIACYTELTIIRIGKPVILSGHSVKRTVECRDTDGNTANYEIIIDFKTGEIRTKLLCNTQRLSDFLQ